MLLTAVAVAGSVVSGAAGQLIETIHPSHPKMEVVEGSFGSTDQARSVYQKESSTRIIAPTPAPTGTR